MKLLRMSGSSSLQTAPCVLSIGNFDGCHLGHQQLLHLAKQRADELALPVAALSFYPLPHEFFQQKNAHMMSVLEKYRCFAAQGLDLFYCLRFDKRLVAMSPDAFVQTVLVTNLSVAHVVVGADFRFGHRRAGDVATLTQLGQRYGFGVSVMPDYCDDVGRISSTRVCDALQQGDIALANRLLGRPYEIEGRVIHGAKLGRTLGFPTANIAIARRNSPLHGIYAVQVRLGARLLLGAASVGTRPAVGGKEFLLEVHLLDFDELIYGQRIRIAFIEKIRGEYDFPSLDELKKQIALDVMMIRDLLLRL